MSRRNKRPKYTHSCKNCKFIAQKHFKDSLGQRRTLDIYYHSRTVDGETFQSFVGRWGDANDDVTSETYISLARINNGYYNDELQFDDVTKILLRFYRNYIANND